MGFWKTILYFCLPVFDDPSDDDFESIVGDHKNTSDDDFESMVGDHKKTSAETQKQNQDLESGVPDENQLNSDDNHRRVSKTIRLLKFLFREQPNTLNIWKKKRQHKFASKLAELLIERDDSWKQTLSQESATDFIGIGERGGDNRGKREEQQYQVPGASKPEGQGQREIALLTATSRGIIEIVKEILKVHPQAIQFCNKEKQNILHVAVLHRRKEIFDMVKRMTIPRIHLVEGIDDNRYTILHCVGNISGNPEGTRPGPAYHLQDELKWFRRVEKIVPPRFHHHHDKKDRTPIELFRTQHKKQLEEAQKWIKDTAQSCSAVAVLVSTVVFAAAYTVPGGSNERGLPNFLASPVFLFFTIMDVVSLTESLTAVVMFLSILSSPSELEDFFESLPRKLTFGFTMLFLSVATTMMAFTATILLVIRLEPRRWTSTLVYAAAFIPVGILALTQFPLYVSFIDTATKIFKKIRKILRLNGVRGQTAKKKSHMH